MRIKENYLNKIMEQTYWLIWSIEHNAWWKPRENGYTTDLEDAGMYSYEKAIEIVDRANITLTMGDKTPHEAMILLTAETITKLVNYQ